MENFALSYDEICDSILNHYCVKHYIEQLLEHFSDTVLLASIMELCVEEGKREL